MKTVLIDIPGPCPTQGSMRFIGKGRMIHQNSKGIKDFRKRVKEAIEPYHKEFYTSNTDVGYIVQIWTYVQKPRTIKRILPTVRGTGDIDKMERACLDALTYDVEKNEVGLFHDDSQVVCLAGMKTYTNDEHPQEHTLIQITKIVLESDFLQNETHFIEFLETFIARNV